MKLCLQRYDMSFGIVSTYFLVGEAYFVVDKF
jgi:hypothetical protein